MNGRATRRDQVDPGATTDASRVAADDEGGESACLAHLVCDETGAISTVADASSLDAASIPRELKSRIC